MNLRLQQLHQQLDGHLQQMSRTLPANYKLTFVARHVGHLLDADIVLTEDNLLKAADALTRRHDAEFDKMKAARQAAAVADYMGLIAEQCRRFLPDGFAFVVLTCPFGDGKDLTMRYHTNADPKTAVSLARQFAENAASEPGEAKPAE